MAELEGGNAGYSQRREQRAVKPDHTMSTRLLRWTPKKRLDAVRERQGLGHDNAFRRQPLMQ